MLLSLIDYWILSIRQQKRIAIIHYIVLAWHQIGGHPLYTFWHSIATYGLNSLIALVTTMKRTEYSSTTYSDNTISTDMNLGWNATLEHERPCRGQTRNAIQWKQFEDYNQGTMYTSYLDIYSVCLYVEWLSPNVIRLLFQGCPYKLNTQAVLRRAHFNTSPSEISCKPFPEKGTP